MAILEQIPMRQDNYSYAIIKDSDVIIVDPSEEQESIKYFNDHPNFVLKAIINTHGHPDHVGGNDILWKKFKCPVYGPKREKERISHINHELSGGEQLNILGMNISCHDVHAHTVGHLAFFVEHAFSRVYKHGHNRPIFDATNLTKKSILFVGDSLFAAGCGRLFEGTPHDLTQALLFYAKQDPDTLMACAHEYTAANLRFAQSIFPDAKAIENRLHSIENLLKEEGSSIPCLFKDEFLTNPFLLAVSSGREHVAKKLSISGEDLPALVGALRKAKDEY